tara:strand:+ start:597 stop:884 length:288 start_codon:yes stop_codon:yes gene_type:complete
MLYLTLYLPLALILKILDRLLLLLRMPTRKKVKPVSITKKIKRIEQVPEDEINDLLDPESDLLSALLDDALIRESIISHLEICYNYQIKQANDEY